MPSVFLYGPDSLQGRIYDRIGPSEAVGGAMLEGWALEFNKPNMKNKDEGLANIVEASGRQVFGVVYDLTPKQLETLDGYFGGYTRKGVEVKLTGENPVTRSAATWLARRIKSGLRPSKSALELTSRGAKENGAPDAFLDELKKVEALDE
jgi:hypothetical protein